MKKVVAWKVLGMLGVMWFLPGAGLRAQSVSDDIQQLLMDVQKLTAFKQMLSDMQKGYTIVSQGYEQVKSLSQGTFSLHKAFLDGLLAVSPAVSSYVKAADIVSKEAQLVQECQSAQAYFQASGQFTSAELGLLLTRYNNAIQGSLKNVDELAMVITAGQLRMSDAERMTAIDRIDRDVTGRLVALQGFDNSTAVEAVQRTRVQQDDNTLRGLYGVGQ